MRTSVYALVSLALGFAGCKQKDLSAVQGLSVNANATNIALMMSGYNKDENDRYYSREAINQLKQALRDATGGTTEFQIREGGSYDDITKARLLEATTQAARDAGENGTVLWYVGTHGWSDGFATAKLPGAANPERVRPSELMQALQAGRTSPMARLIMLFDHCGSGGVINGMGLQGETRAAGGEELTDVGQQAKDKDKPSGDATAEYNEFFSELSSDLEDAGRKGMGLTGGTYAPPALYNQALFFAPAAANQTTAGDNFTTAISEVVASAKTANTGMTISQFLNETVAKLARNNTDEYPTDTSQPVSRPQRAVFRALPDNAILNDTLFTRAGSSGTSAQTSTRTSTTSSTGTTGTTGTSTTTTGGSCAGAYGLEWAPTFARDSRGQCRVATNYCTCWPIDGGKECGLWDKGAPDTAQPFAHLAKVDAGGGCYDSCTDLAKANKAEMQRRCGNALVVINRSRQLEAWSYTNILASGGTTGTTTTGTTGTTGTTTTGTTGTTTTGGRTSTSVGTTTGTQSGGSTAQLSSVANRRGSCQCGLAVQANYGCAVFKGAQVMAYSANDLPDRCATACNLQGGRFRDILNGQQCN